MVVEIVESRVMADLKAKSEKNAVDSSVWSYSPGFKEENCRKTSELEKSGFGCFGMRKSFFRHEGGLGWENGVQIRKFRPILGLETFSHLNRTEKVLTSPPSCQTSNFGCRDRRKSCDSSFER